MKKIRSKAGFTLVEMLVSIAIMSMLVVGIGTGMDVGSRVYADAIFESDSSALAGILNNSIGDVLRYSSNVIKNDHGGFVDKENHPISDTAADFVFTNYDYGVQDAYFCNPEVINVAGSAPQITKIGIRTLTDSHTLDLVNNGSYPNLQITKFHVTYFPPKEVQADGTGRGGYFQLSYTIENTAKTKEREITHIVRLMNTPLPEATVPAETTH